MKFSQTVVTVTKNGQPVPSRTVTVTLSGDSYFYKLVGKRFKQQHLLLVMESQLLVTLVLRFPAFTNTPTTNDGALSAYAKYNEAPGVVNMLLL
ncbi:MAG: hypothetical protein QM571_04105 [Micrococcaceae bacterium]